MYREVIEDKRLSTLGGLLVQKSEVQLLITGWLSLEIGLN